MRELFWLVMLVMTLFAISIGIRTLISMGYL